MAARATKTMSHRVSLRLPACTSGEQAVDSCPSNCLPLAVWPCVNPFHSLGFHVFGCTASGLDQRTLRPLLIPTVF